jgi:hypothetical protein
MKRLAIVFILLLGLLTPSVPSAHAGDGALLIASDYLEGYDRTLFKHWIDADKDGCDTRAEVLIEEAIVKPKIGPKCKLTGGKWISAYDGKTITNSSLLDIDHMVPLAEAWRSGAWNWTEAQRQAFANDLENSAALIAVTLTTNRSKGDSDPALWMPNKEVCTYTKNWIAVKVKYLLTVDSNEANKLNSLTSSCALNVNTWPTGKPSASSPPTTTPTQCTNGVYKIVSVSVEDKAKLSELENSLLGYLKLNTSHTESINTALALIMETKLFTITVCNTKRAYLPELAAKAAVDSRVQSAMSVTNLIRKIQEEVGTNQVPTPPSQDLLVTPGAFCTPAGATGKSKSGVSYTCKTSATDTRNRWRP